MFERFFLDDDSTLIDRTIEWSTPYTASGSWDCKSYVYVASYLPFNHRYFDIVTANDKAGTLSIDVWYNSAWQAVVDKVDYTNVLGKTLAKSGNIYFTPDELKGWEIEDESSDIDELSGTKVYNTYWMRFGIDAAEDSSCVINYIGYKFADDYALFSFYPLFNNTNLMGQFKSGKTSWSEQEISASTIIISDLKKRNFITSKNQVLDSKAFEICCIHKTAELIFSGLGSSYADEKAAAKKDYLDAFNANNLKIDVNNNGVYDRFENRITYNILSR